WASRRSWRAAGGWRRNESRSRTWRRRFPPWRRAIDERGVSAARPPLLVCLGDCVGNRLFEALAPGAFESDLRERQTHARRQFTFAQGIVEGVDVAGGAEGD